MGLIADRYASLLRTLLPPGRAWEHEAGSIFGKLLAGFSEELARVEERAHDVLDEMDPRTTLELLSDWERLVRIPDDIQAVASTITQRRLDVLRKLVARGGQDAAFYISIAALFGYQIEVKECFEFRVDSKTGRIDNYLFGADFTFYWRVIAPGLVGTDEVLEAVIRASAPAHTHVIFKYGGS